MRKLATIRQVTSVEPIKGKDRVELAHVDGWTCMVSKADNFKQGSFCVFCEPDSVFPATEQWEFLAKYHYRIKTQKFKDADGNPVYSQGLCLPITIPQLKGLKIHVGDDVTELLGITQYEPTMDIEEPIVTKKYPQWLMRMKWFRKLVLPKKTSSAFPNFISKTDEERIQNCASIVDCDTEWVATEKVDGQSGTFAVVRHKKLFWYTYEFIVCSRNTRKPKPDTSSYWQVAKRYEIEKGLTAYLKNHPELEWVALQGECIAPNVQGNKYHVKEADLFIFNFITSKDGRYDSIFASKMVSYLGLKFVPILGTMSLKGKSVQDILDMSNGTSFLYNTLREGIVFRSTDGKKSFKAVSPEFLIKHNE